MGIRHDTQCKKYRKRNNMITGHHRDSTSLVWILSQWQVFQGGLGRRGIHRTSTDHWGFSGIGYWTPPLLHIHYITGSHYTSTWFLMPFLCGWHTALSLISTRWSKGSCMDLRLPGRHLGVHERTSPTTQPGKDCASCLPCHSNSSAWLHHPAGFFYNYPIKFSQKSGCNIRWPADFQRPHCKNCLILQVCTTSERCCATGPCRPFLTQHAAQLLVQALVISRLDYCNALLAGLQSCTIKLLQMIQNAAAWLVFSEPKRAHVTPLFISLHWLPVAAHIKFKTLMHAYRTATGSAPSYLHSLITIYIPSRSLGSASERRLVVPSQRGTKSLSRTFSFTIPGWWNELPTLIRNAESQTIFKRHLKTHLFRHHLISSKKKKKKHFTLSLTLLSFP